MSDGPDTAADPPLLTTKLHAPTRRRGMVERSRLTDRLGARDLPALTLVSAPAGFGKTTLVAEWLSGGQPADRGVLRWAGGEVRVERVEADGDAFWLVLAAPVVVDGAVLGVVDAAFRRQMCQLHTGLHIVNALAFQGALL